MKSIKQSSIMSIVLLFSFLIYSSLSFAAADQQTTIQTLLAENHLTISQRLVPENPLLGQEVTLEIEISTDRWFAGGTRLKPTLIDDVLVMQRQSLATNSSKQERGQTWVVQLWELSLFAQEAGALFSPAIDVNLKINTDAGIIEGVHRLKPMLMQVSVPAEVAGIEQWLAAKNFSIESSLSRSLDNLQLGDAFTQTIKVRADNVLAMMLPKTKIPVIDGLGIYPQPAQLKNNNNRGAKEAIRIETINFVVEQTGRYTLPSQTFYWWDTDSHTLREEALQAVSFSIGSTTVSADNSNAFNYAAIITEQWHFLVTVLIFIIFMLGYRLWMKHHGNTSNSIPSARKLRKYILQAINRQDWKMALRWAYLWMDNDSSQSSATPLRQYLSHIKKSSSTINKDREELEKLFENAFSKHNNPASFSLTMFMQTKKNKAQTIDEPLRINPR